jgi:hypothetical protein
VLSFIKLKIKKVVTFFCRQPCLRHRAIGFMEPVFCGESLLRDPAIALWNLSVKTQNKSRL